MCGHITLNTEKKSYMNNDFGNNDDLGNLGLAKFSIGALLLNMDHQSRELDTNDAYDEILVQPDEIEESLGESKIETYLASYQFNKKSVEMLGK